MDIQFWIWVIVIVITLIARANKKKNAQPPEPQDSPDQPTRQQPKQISFEDLLKEIQGEKAIAKAPPKKVEKEYDFVDYDDDIPDEIQNLEDVDYDFSKDEKVFEDYEAAKKMAKERPTIKEQPVVQDSLVRLEHFKGYNQTRKRKLSFKFLDEIKDPEGFKKAFIMSEILRRKY